MAMVWSREEIARELWDRCSTDRPINPSSLPAAMVKEMKKQLGSLEIAYEYFGFDPAGVMRKPELLSATELIIEIQAWKKRYGRCRFEDMVKMKPGFVDQLRRVFGGFGIALHRAGLNPHEEAGILVLGSTLWFNPTDIYLSLAQHWPRFMGYHHEVELPVLAWDIAGQPRVWQVTFMPTNPEKLIPDDLVVGKSWWFDLSTTDLDSLAKMAAEVMLFGVLPWRSERDPDCLRSHCCFMLDEMVERYWARVPRPEEMTACKRSITYTALRALAEVFNLIEIRAGHWVSGMRTIESSYVDEEHSRLESGNFYLDSSVWTFNLSKLLFGQVQCDPDEADCGPKKSTPQAGYYAVLPSQCATVSGSGRQIVSLCLNMLKNPDGRHEADGQQMIVSKPVDLGQLGMLLWWQEIPDYLRIGPSYPPLEQTNPHVIPVWNKTSSLPARGVRTKLEPILQQVHELWPRLRGWEFDNEHVRFFFAPEVETQPEAS